MGRRLCGACEDARYLDRAPFASLARGWDTMLVHHSSYFTQCRISALALPNRLLDLGNGRFAPSPLR
jgi:hypothetical protein